MSAARTFSFRTTACIWGFVMSGNLGFVNLATGSVTWVTDDGGETTSNGVAEFIAAEEMHRFRGYWWSPDDAQIAFTRVDESSIPVTVRQEVYADRTESVPQRYPFAGGPNAAVALRVYALASGETETLDWADAPEDYLARVDWIGGSLAVQVQSRDQQSLTLKLVDQGQAVAYVTERSDTWINLHDNLTQNAPETFLWTSERNGQSELYRCAPPAEPEQITDQSFHVGQVIAADAAHAWFSGWQTTPVEAHLYRVDLDTRHVEQLTDAPGWHQTAVCPSPLRIAHTRSATDCAPQLQWRSGDGSTEVIIDGRIDADHPYHDYLATATVPVFGQIPTVDGQRLHYRLTPPVATDNAPVIVYVYGGPGAQKVKDEFPPLVLQLFAHAGFGVLEIDNRGSTNRGRLFEAPIFKHMGGAEVVDQTLARDILDEVAWADTSRIGIFGHSYGGYMTLMCLAQAPEIFKAGASVAPVTDWALYDTHYTERYLGTPQADAAAYERSNVLPYANAIERPLLLVHGMADDNVLFTHTTRLVSELQRLGKQFELMAYPGSKHSLAEPHVSVHRFELIIDFFRRHLC